MIIPTNADERTRWLLGQLDAAATTLGVTPDDRPVYDHHPRAAAVRVLDADGGRAWLRIVYDDPDWGEGPFWDNSVNANAIEGVPKPTVLCWLDIDDEGRRLRAELSTYVTDGPVSQQMLLTTDPGLDQRWFTDLDTALTTLATHPLPEYGVGADDIEQGALAYFGLQVDISAIRWTTAHADLHWGNVTAPQLMILDWETWGRAPAGYDAATLLCTSLLRPETNQRLRRGLAAHLDTAAGWIALVAAAVRLLRFVDNGELSEIAIPVRRLITETVDV